MEGTVLLCHGVDVLTGPNASAYLPHIALKVLLVPPPAKVPRQISQIKKRLSKSCDSCM